MFKNFYNFNFKNLIKIRLHLGHKEEKTHSSITSYLYGTRHNINILDLNKIWYPYRQLFFTLVYMFYRRNCFFIIGINPNLPMSNILENLLNQYSLKNKYHFYLSGYIDRKWIEGLFSNWKIFQEFIRYLDISNSNFLLKKKYKFQRYFEYLKGIRFLQKNPIPDFFIFLNKNETAQKEINLLQTPLIGLVDTDMDINLFLFKYLGNNDNLENIEFFFNFLNLTIKEGRFLEIQQFLKFFVFKIKDVLKMQKLKKKESFLKKKPHFKFFNIKKKIIK